MAGSQIQSSEFIPEASQPPQVSLITILVNRFRQRTQGGMENLNQLAPIIQGATGNLNQFTLIIHGATKNLNQLAPIIEDYETEIKWLKI